MPLHSSSMVFLSMVVAAFVATTMLTTPAPTLAASLEGRGYSLIRVSVASHERVVITNDHAITIRDLSPDRQQVVFTELGSALYVGSTVPGARREVASGALTGSATWSPAGGRIAFAQYGRCTAGTCPQVWSVESSGAHLHKLVDDVDQPAWSSDGTLLAARSGQGNSLVFTRADGTPVRTTALPGVATSLTWLRSRGVVVAVRADSSSHLFFAPPTGGLRGLGAGHDPVTRPDGQAVAYLANGDLFERRIVGTKRVNLGRATGLGSYSPDARTLAFTATTGRGDQVFTIRRGTLRRIEVTREPAATDVTQIWWSRSGSALYYARRDGSSDTG